MRTIVILGLWSLSLGLFASSALAGNVEECEQLKGGTPGLYGLCLAYANAGNDNARERIAANYARKMGPGDPTLEELFVGGATCPCWDAEYLATVASQESGLIGLFCTIGDTLDIAAYVDFGPPARTLNLSAGFLPGDPFGADVTGCVVGASSDELVYAGVSNAMPVMTSELQDQACSDQLRVALQAPNFMDDCGQFAE